MYNASNIPLQKEVLKRFLVHNCWLKPHQLKAFPVQAITWQPTLILCFWGVIY